MEGLLVGPERGKMGPQKPDEAPGRTGLISEGEYLAAYA